MLNINLAFLVSGRAVGPSDHNAPYWEQPFSQPYFDNTTRRDVTTTVGQTAHLHCRVRNLGDRAVHIACFVVFNNTRHKPVERDVHYAYLTETAWGRRILKSKDRSTAKYILSFYVMLMTT